MNVASLKELEYRLRQADESLSLTPGAVMAKYTTLHLGGPADLLASPATEQQLCLLLREAAALDVPVTLIGNGSNLLVRDGGIRGLVVRLCRDMNRIDVDGSVLKAQAGALLSRVAMTAAEHSLSGLAFAGGIPGAIGGSVYMNAGAYGGELCQVVTRVDGVDRSGVPFSYSGEEMNFGYRHSRLMDEDKIVTSVTMQLQPGDREQLLAEMADLNRRRQEKQPISQFSAGSTFKRPVGGFAAQMIDECGLKGYTIGGAQVSEKHAGFLINRGDKAADFLALMAHVQSVVYDRFGVMLEAEVRILGTDDPATLI